MKNFVAITQHDKWVSVVLPIQSDELLAIGDKLEALHEEAYMNGYNWAALLNRYLAAYHPSLMQELETDPEAGTYVAYYPLSPANLQRATQLAALLNGLLQQPQQLYDFVQAEGNHIEWD